jgi:hypothetical protein
MMRLNPKPCTNAALPITCRRFLNRRCASWPTQGAESASRAASPLKTPENRRKVG